MNECKGCRYYQSDVRSHRGCCHPNGKLFYSRFSNPDGSTNDDVLSGKARPLCFETKPPKPTWVLPLCIYLGITWFVMFLFAFLFVLTFTVDVPSRRPLGQAGSGWVGIVVWIGAAAIFSILAAAGLYSSEMYRKIKWYHIIIYTLFAAAIGFRFWQIM